MLQHPESSWQIRMSLHQLPSLNPGRTRYRQSQDSDGDTLKRGENSVYSIIKHTFLKVLRKLSQVSVREALASTYCRLRRTSFNVSTF